MIGEYYVAQHLMQLDKLQLLLPHEKTKHSLDTAVIEFPSRGAMQPASSTEKE